MRDITLGQYYGARSAVHSLDPRTKLFSLLLFVTALFFVKDQPLWYIPPAVLLVLCFYAANIPARFALRGLRPIVVLLCFTFFFRMTLTPGTEIAHFWIFTVTQEGIVKAVRMTLRIALMISAASLIAYTTTPRELADGLETASLPLQKLGVPVRSMAVMLMIAFRFIPVMLEEINTLLDAQAARGAEFDSPSVWKRTKYVLSLPMPVFLSCVRRAAELAMAMEARGYQEGADTTRMNPLAYAAADRRVYAAGGALFAVYTVLLVLFGTVV